MSMQSRFTFRRSKTWVVRSNAAFLRASQSSNHRIGRIQINHTAPCIHHSQWTQSCQQRCFASTAADYDGTKTVREAKDLALEDQYSRKTPLEHVLLRPSMYVGSNEKAQPIACWVPDPIPTPPTEELLMKPTSVVQYATVPDYPIKMVRLEYGLVPALNKVFDEILVNAADNLQRHPDSCTRIDVIIDPGSDNRDPFIRVRNDGKGIPVQVHQKEGMYVPEMLFGHLLTGSNFDDNEKRLTGGRHGFGAKLTNIFSKSFTVETLDSRKQLKYRQTWSSNMTNASSPEIVEVPADATDYTCVSFVPDVARLTNDASALSISKEDYALMCRRVLDVAGCSAGRLRVTLNGVDVTMGSFPDYARLYRKQDSLPVCFDAINSRWTVGVGLSETGSFEMVSFVNGMATSRGGTHVNSILQQVIKKIQEKIEKTDPELVQMASQGVIRRHLFVSVAALIENPTFDSQMKECLTSSPADFGSSFSLSESFIKSVLQSEEEGGPGIVEEIRRAAQSRQQATLLKVIGGKTSKRQLLSIPKLEDAHHAGTKSGSECTLILTEGDSAKALAVAGLEVIGRARYGVFPLRGKLLNVREAAVSQMAKNAEVTALCAIIGLDFDKTYETIEERRKLRYGKVMLMTDQDTDGSHIKGLVMNFFRYFWPNLLKPPVDLQVNDEDETPPFLSSFVTPLLKASKKSSKTGTLSFYSMAEYKKWRGSIEAEDFKKWTVKYYKGLGTSTPAEAREYFSAFNDHFRPFLWNSDIDGELLDMVFDGERAADRRAWILDVYDETSNLLNDPSAGNNVSYEDFINKEMIHFSNADNIRSIPSAIDGLKPSQRKVLYACFKRKLKSEIKVAQLTGYCAEHTAYHHGEASLQSTIIGMAQDFVGSNNINLLVPSGQFGTRIMGGADAASPRYIYTYLAPIARSLFPEADDTLLSYLEDDGQQIEPEFYCPIIPLLVVNGCQGIGTGWSTFIPPHSANDVLEYILAKLDGAERLPKIHPFARGFQGRIEPDPNGNGYVSFGRSSCISDRTILIDELPLRCWTNKYKGILLKMRDRGEVTSFVENHNTSKVSFLVTLKSAQLARMTQAGLEKSFKLKTNLQTTNMHAFNKDGQICKFDTAESIVEAFFPVRMQLYQDRIALLQSLLNYEASILRNKAGFIKAVTSGDIDLTSGRRSKQETSKMLKERGFLDSVELNAIKNENVLWKRRQFASEKGEGGSNLEPMNFDYLLNMPLSSLTSEKIRELGEHAATKDKELEEMKSTTPVDLWRRDLQKLALLL